MSSNKSGNELDPHAIIASRLNIRNVLFFVSAGFIVLTGIILIGAKEPSDQGRSLSEWVLVLRHPRYPRYPGGPHVPSPEEIKQTQLAQQKAREAIQRIGPRSVPHLENMLKPPSRLAQFNRLLLSKFNLVRRPSDRDDGLREGAEAALMVLGPDAVSAFNTVLRYSGNYPQIMFAMGERAIPKLSNALHNPDPRLQQRAMNGLVTLRESPTAVPVFLKFAASTNEYLVGKSIACLMWFAQDHPEVQSEVTNNPAVAIYLRNNRPFTPAAWFK